MLVPLGWQWYSPLLGGNVSPIRVAIVQPLIGCQWYSPLLGVNVSPLLGVNGIVPYWMSMLVPY